jgi:hypothetical protein
MAVAVGAVLAVLAATPALASLSPNQLPGDGALIYQTGAMTASATTTFSSEAITISGSAATATPAAVVQWGSLGAITPMPGLTSASPGFNIGSQASVTIFNHVTGPGNTPVPMSLLNIDATGNPSEIAGALTYTGASPSNPGSLWIANANGILIDSTANIIAPNGLGLLNDPADTSLGFAQSFASGTVPINFSAGNVISEVGVAIQSGASLGSVGGFLLVAGYGSVNIASAPSTVPLIVDGGIGANVTTTANVSAGNLIANDNSSAPGYYTDAQTTVAVSLGTASPFTNLNAIVDGDIVNTGVLTVTQGQINWINGTFTNDGTLDVNAAAGSYGVLGFNTFQKPTYIPSGATPSIPLYGNTSSTAPTGNFTNLGIVNATGSTLGQVFFVEGFQNNYGATLNVSGSLYIDSSSNGVTLAGSVSPLSGNLVIAAFGADTLGIYAPVSVTGTSSSISLYGNLVDITQSLSATGTSSTFNYTSIEPGYAQLNLASTGNITANQVNMGTSGPALSNFDINGTVDATSTSATSNAAGLVFGGSGTPTGDVTGTGSITASSIDFVNLQGNVNNIISPVIALNGFHVNAQDPTSSATDLNTVNLSFYADGGTSTTPVEQGINLKVNGNLAIDSGNTQAIDAGGVAPANQNSILYAQATGNVQVNAGSGTNYYGPANTPIGNLGLGGNGSANLFQFPGLVYLQAGDNGASTASLTVGSPTAPVVIANAFSSNAQFGRAGVFLIAPTINYNYDPTTNTANAAAQVLYTNGNAGVVFAAPYTGLGFPNAVINGALSSTTNLMPQIDFLQSVTATNTYPYGLELVPTDTFTNANGNQQQMQTFLNLY